METWECKIVFIGGGKDYCETEALINRVAADGWELVSVTPSPDGRGERAYFRRRR